MKYLNQDYDTIEALKEHFRVWARKLHPDLNPESSGEEMKALNIELEQLIKQFKEKAKAENRKQYYSAAEEYDFEQDIMNKLIELAQLKMKNVDTEVIGNWIWLTKNTKEYKESLKELGFNFAGNKKAWYWHATPFRKKSSKKLSMNALRAMYETTVVNIEEMDEKAQKNQRKRVRA